MKITEQILRQIIREESRRVLREVGDPNWVAPSPEQLKKEREAENARVAAALAAFDADPMGAIMRQHNARPNAAFDDGFEDGSEEWSAEEQEYARGGPSECCF